MGSQILLVREGYFHWFNGQENPGICGKIRFLFRGGNQYHRLFRSNPICLDYLIEFKVFFINTFLNLDTTMAKKMNLKRPFKCLYLSQV